MADRHLSTRSYSHLYSHHPHGPIQELDLEVNVLHQIRHSGGRRSRILRHHSRCDALAGTDDRRRSASRASPRVVEYDPCEVLAGMYPGETAKALHLNQII